MSHRTTPPRWALWVLRATTPAEWRDSVEGDFVEEWKQKTSSTFSRTWILRHIGAVVTSFLWERLSSPRINQTGASRESSEQNWGREPEKPKGDGPMQDIWQDIHFGLRQWRKNPGFVAVAVITLALGLGANAAIFNIVHNVLFNPLPFPDSDRIVMIWGTDQKTGSLKTSVSYPNFRDWQERNRTLDSMAVFQRAWVNYTTDNGTERLRGAWVGGKFFETLKVKPLHGRFFLPEERRRGAEPSAVLSHAFWQQRLGGDPAVLGKTLPLNGRATQIVGILPENFYFPLLSRETNFWFPTARNSFIYLQRRFYCCRSVARLKPGTTLEQARADMNNIAVQMRSDYPKAYKNRGVTLVPFYEEVVGESRASLLLLLGVTGFVLLIACANLANLLLARGAARQIEFSIRRALGASRGRLVRQMLIESVLLGLAGGLLGMIVSPVLTSALLTRLNSWGVPRLSEVGFDASVAGFTLVLALLSSLLLGLLPALQSSALPLAAALKENTRTGTAGKRTRIRQLLIVGEVALSLVLLTGAGLMIRSFVNLTQVDPGFQTENLLKLRVLVRGEKYNNPEILANFYREVTDQINSLPGVLATGASTTIPLGGGSWRTDFHILSRMNPETDDGIEFRYYSVMPDYFEAIGIPLLRGRNFTEQDRANPVGAAIISRTMAEQHWPNGNPIGERLKMGIRFGQEGEPETFEIVGVVGDVRHTGLDTRVRPQIYVPYRQQTNNAMTFVVRTAGDPLDSLDAIRARIAALDKNAPLYQITTMEELFNRATASRRVAASMLGGFSLLALVLTCVGLFGVISYAVNQRVHEFGVRLALGAQPGDILRLVFRQSFLLIGIGSVLGLLGAAGLTRFLENFLFGVSATDPLTFGLTVLLLGVIALLACWVPARRAMKVDPMVALRYE